MKATGDKIEGGAVSGGEELPEPEVDPNGVDRAQIREALALTPLERLRQHDRFMRQVVGIRRANGWD